MTDPIKRADGEGTIERRGARVYAKGPWRSDGSRVRNPARPQHDR